MLTFKDLQDEIKRRATRDQGGTQFENAVKNVINSSLFRISREAPWRCLRRHSTITTIPDYVTGTNYGYATLTSSSNIVTISNGRLRTDKIAINRRIKFSTSSIYYSIDNIISDTQLVLDQDYSSASCTNSNYSIYPQGEYNIPIQASHRMFLWHEDYGYPLKLQFMTDQTFYDQSLYLTEKGTPIYYRMWGEDMVEEQITSATNLSISSSSTSDTTQQVTIFGTVSGYPDSEVVSLNGTTTVTTSNLFTQVERVSKNALTTGRITITGNSASTTVSVIPSGDITAGVKYKKIYLYPLPEREFKLHCNYYKDPYRLVKDGDIHEMGQDFDEAIILLSVSKIKGETEQAGAGSFYSMWQDEMRTLRRVNMDKIDWFPTLHRPDYGYSNQIHPILSYNQIGSNYGRSSRR